MLLGCRGGPRKSVGKEGVMPRARLYLIPGYVWHLTHRCHDRQFLLRFDLDKRNWMDLMFQAIQRYGLHVLSFTITSNHIHILVYADGRKHVIPRSIMLAASRTALDYNRRKDRTGAFWEGNYHATAVETGQHFQNCVVYIDLNMVRAGVVGHPEEWPFCGYQEIVGSRTRSRLVEKKLLMELMGVSDKAGMRKVYEGWIDDALRSKDLSRKSMWTEAVAVGREAFIDRIQADLGLKATYREKCVESGGFILKEASGTYGHGT